MTDRKCRFGILGAANIARKNWQAILNSGNSTLTAVASRDPARAEQFIAECQGQVPFNPKPRATTYDELLASKDIDAVYIPLPTGLRQEWVEKAAAAGIKDVCFDRGHNKYHGRVAALADAAREAGLSF